MKGGGPTVKNVTGFDLPRLLVGSLGTLGVLVQVILRCQPRARRRRVERDRRRSVRRAPPHATGRRASRGTASTTHVLVEGVAADVARERHAAGAEPVGGRARVARRPAPRPHLGRARPRSRARGRRSTAPACAGSPRSASAPCTSPPTPRPRSPPPAPPRSAHGGWLLREAGAPGLDGFGRAAAEPGDHAADPRRVRSRRASSTRPVRARPRAAVEVDGQVDGETACMTLRRRPASRAPSRARGRRGRAGRVRRVRPVPAALPDVPRHRPRDRVAARAASRRCARSSSTARRSTTRSARTMEACVQCRGCEAACPSGVPFGHLMEGTREALAHAADARRAGRAPRRRVARVRRRAAASLAAARAHVAALARRSACTSCRAGSGCRSSRCGRCARRLDRRDADPTRTCSPGASWTRGSATSTAPRSR